MSRKESTNRKSSRKESKKTIEVAQPMGGKREPDLNAPKEGRGVLEADKDLVFKRDPTRGPFANEDTYNSMLTKYINQHDEFHGFRDLEQHWVNKNGYSSEVQRTLRVPRLTKGYGGSFSAIADLNAYQRLLDTGQPDGPANERVRDRAANTEEKVAKSKADRKKERLRRMAAGEDDGSGSDSGSDSGSSSGGSSRGSSRGRPGSAGSAAE